MKSYLGERLAYISFYQNLWRKIYKHRVFSSLIVISMFFSALLEGAGFGLFLPFLQQFSNSKSYEPFILFQKLNISFASREQELLAILMLISTCIVLRNVFIILNGWSVGKILGRLIYDIRQELLNKLLKNKYSFFVQESSGRLTNLFSVQVRHYVYSVRGLIEFSFTLLLVFVYLAILLKLSWQATLASLVLFGTISVLFRRVTRVFNNLGITLIKREEGISTFIMETLLGMKLIKTFLMEKVRHEQQEEQNREVADTLKKQQFYKKCIDPSIELIVLLVLGILLTFLILYGKDFSYDLPLLITFLIILMRLKQVVSMMLGKIGELGGLAGGTKNVVDLLSQKEVVIEDGDYICPSPVKKIEFRNVSFSYNGKNVLENMSLQINRGETVAIVGKSGAGKSTLIDLFLNLYQPKHGDILVDGQFLRDIKRESWYRKIGVVFQDSFIFNNSICWNITCGKTDEISLAKVKEAARIANVTEFVAQMEEGYDTIVGDRGVKLSGGQRQRIAIARAIVQTPEILILDEAVSSLDSYNERLITEALRAASHNRTSIIVAHRLSTVLLADRIVVLKDGRIEAIGAHKELLKKSPEYQLLYNSQFQI